MKRILKHKVSILKFKLLALTLAVFGAYLVLYKDTLQANWLRWKVGSKVVMILGKKGGGTGFFVKAPSGKTFLLTNRHVCNIPGGDLHLEQNERLIPLKIVEQADFTDLCLLQATDKTVSGIELSESVDIGNEVNAIGHPHLMPLTNTKGFLVGYGDAIVMVEVGPCPVKSPKMFKYLRDYGVCVMNIPAGLTNVTILPGSSGSPAVNVWGDLVGVFFAGDTQSNWGLIIPLGIVKKFLAPY